MTNLIDLFSAEDLAKQISLGYVGVQTHPLDEDLKILNYTHRCQFDQAWNSVTMSTRGLIYRKSTGVVVSRGFAKFFNFDDSSQPNPPAGAVVKSEKFDGSLGIIYLGPVGLAVSTRGSFDSPQAQHATKRLCEYLEMFPQVEVNLRELLSNDYTPLVEIIYPENRIVLQYGELDELVLLDIIDNASAESDITLFDDLEWPADKAEKTLISGGFYDTMISDVPDNKEGFVLYWPHSGFRCKVKGATYMALHRILTNTSAREIWRFMAVNSCKAFVPEGKEHLWATLLGTDPRKAVAAVKAGPDWLDDLIVGVPDEFYDWIEDTMETINNQVVDTIEYIKDSVEDMYSQNLETPRQRAEASKKYKHSGAVLRWATYADRKALVAYAWKEAFPPPDKPFSSGVDED